MQVGVGIQVDGVMALVTGYLQVLRVQAVLWKLGEWQDVVHLHIIVLQPPAAEVAGAAVLLVTASLGCGQRLSVELRLALARWAYFLQAYVGNVETQTANTDMMDKFLHGFILLNYQLTLFRLRYSSIADHRSDHRGCRHHRQTPTGIVLKLRYREAMT